VLYQFAAFASIPTGHCGCVGFVGYAEYGYPAVCATWPQEFSHSVRGLSIGDMGSASVVVGLPKICCGGLLPILFGFGELVSRGLEGGNVSVSEVPHLDPEFEPCLRGTNRAVPPRALDKASSSSFVTTFSQVNLGRRDFLDW